MTRSPVAGDGWVRWSEVGRRMVARYPDAITGFLSGSFLDGFATPTSDLDVFVLVAENRAPAADPGIASASVAAEGRRIDIDYVDDISTDTEVWTVDAVIAVAAELAGIGLADWNAAGGLTETKLNLAHRVRIGEPVYGEAEFRALRGRFDWARLATIVRNRCLCAYNSLADDAIGAIQASDAMTSVLMSRDALGAAADALTAAFGHTNPKPKWRWRKLLALGLDEPAEAYRRAELDSGEDDRTMIASSKARLRLASEFVVTASAENPGK